MFCEDTFGQSWCWRCNLVVDMRPLKHGLNMALFRFLIRDRAIRCVRDMGLRGCIIVSFDCNLLGRNMKQKKKKKRIYER